MPIRQDKIELLDEIKSSYKLLLWETEQIPLALMHTAALTGHAKDTLISP